MLRIHEVEVFEPLFLVCVPNPFYYLFSDTPQKDIMRGWGTLSSHFSFPAEAEQRLPAVCNAGGRERCWLLCHFRTLWRGREELDGLSLEFTECPIFLTVGPGCSGKGIEYKQKKLWVSDFLPQL